MVRTEHTVCKGACCGRLGKESQKCYSSATLAANPLPERRFRLRRVPGSASAGPLEQGPGCLASSAGTDVGRRRRSGRGGRWRPAAAARPAGRAPCRRRARRSRPAGRRRAAGCGAAGSRCGAGRSSTRPRAPGRPSSRAAFSASPSTNRWTTSTVTCRSATSTLRMSAWWTPSGRTAAFPAVSTPARVPRRPGRGPWRRWRPWPGGPAAGRPRPRRCRRPSPRPAARPRPRTNGRSRRAADERSAVAGRRSVPTCGAPLSRAASPRRWGPTLHRAGHGGTAPGTLRLRVLSLFGHTARAVPPPGTDTMRAATVSVEVPRCPE